ncbi:hypothetical protein MJL48_31310, partial [Salmonella enterica subsp. enterica serovar Kentucky]|nr:hypothetical protein [Salmonella enterica subsp. enterica serovar Kentucky]
SVLRKALSSQQLASRIEAYEEAQNILEKELPILPLASSLRLHHYLFSGKRTAAFRSLDDISLWIEKGSLRQLIVDMEALPVSCI